MLNNSTKEDFEELMFWGRISGNERDYYIAVGLTYNGQYEFPNKRFFFATSANFEFTAFPELNTQHESEYNGLTGNFTGNPEFVLRRVV